MSIFLHWLFHLASYFCLLCAGKVLNRSPFAGQSHKPFSKNDDEFLQSGSIDPVVAKCTGALGWSAGLHPAASAVDGDCPLLNVPVVVGSTGALGWSAGTHPAMYAVDRDWPLPFGPVVTGSTGAIGWNARTHPALNTICYHHVILLLRCG